MRPAAPRIGFLIGGVQKAGTSALARYLSAHPALALPRDKEAHVFDAPDFDGWDGPRIEREYATHFDGSDDDRLHGDATPIYLFHETLIARIAAYNPKMRWVVLVRDPAERALSQYAMERGRGDERWPLWAALAFEHWRLRGHADDFAEASPLRHWSYRARGDYVRQLRALWRHFPRAQTLVIDNAELRRDHAAVLRRICAFLDVPGFIDMPSAETVFSGPPGAPSPLSTAFARWLLRRERREYRTLVAP